MLRQYQCLRVRAAHVLAECAPEIVVVLRRMPQIRRHIQPPSVHIVGRRYPFAGNAHNIVKQLGGCFIVELGQRIMPPPAIVGSIIWPFFRLCLMELEKGMVRAVLGYIRALLVTLRLLIDFLAVKPLVKRPAVIEHAVQDHLHPAPVNLLHKGDKESIARLKVLL